jgi:hypothetical protein
MSHSVITWPALTATGQDPVMLQRDRHEAVSALIMDRMSGES